MEQQTQPQMESPPPSGSPDFNYAAFQAQAVSYLKAWPGQLIELFTKPDTAIAALPTQGKWARPVVYGLASGLLMGVISFLMFIRFAPSMVFSTVIADLIGALVGVFLGGFVLNLICSVIAKDPQIYRSILFVSLLGLLSPIGMIAGRLHPILMYAPFAAFLYLLYKYVQVAAGATQKQAYIFIGILAGLALLSGVGLLTTTYFLTRPMMRY